ncbi:EAL domain-containing protein [Fredinandcohnia onubensis]|uniref:EAL domain-containing protein n=1 Tax=Fredinandcohnia onubensis TaxID=1571209 RepID=UPI000C0C0071|nr:EAL domain-containing protein [Fredinandcohnia onubensis]
MAGLSFLKQLTRLSNETVNLSGKLNTIMEHDTYLLKELIDNHPHAVLAFDVNVNLLHYNPSVLKIFGYNEKELPSKLKQYLHENDKYKRNKFYQRALQGKVQNYQTAVTHANGEIIYIDVNLIPIKNSDGDTTIIYAVAKDITTYVQHEKELVKIKGSLELAQKVGAIGSYDYDIIEDEAYWSNQMYVLFGIENIDGFVPTFNSISELAHPDDREKFKKAILSAIEEKRNLGFEFRILRKDGTVVYVYNQADVILDENKKPVRFIGTVQDITKRRTAELKLKESENRIEHIFDNLEVGIWSYDVKKARYMLISKGAETISGYSPTDFYNRLSWDSLVHPDDFPAFQEHQMNIQKGQNFFHQYRIIHRNGDIVWVQEQVLPVLDENGHVIRLDGIVSNITEQKEFEKKIQHLAFHDYLTKLPNRMLFENKINELISASNQINKHFSILYIDLDRFRNINESLGHQIGDKLLFEFSQRVNMLLNKNTLFARLGGDEFGVILWDYEESDYPNKAAKLIIDCLDLPVNIEDFELIITTSVGISTFPENGKTIEELIKNADAALYRAKASGKNTYQIYSSSLSINSFKQYYLERDLRKSIENNQLVVYFQPRVDSGTGKIVSAEALVRWEHPVWGLVSPLEFIPLAEETGYINEIGDWVLDQVCQNIAKWEQQNLEVVPISVNISAQRFLKSDWKAKLGAILENNNTNPSLIELEITETTMIKHEEAVKLALQYIKSIGLKIALDDFGTGYSSITYLKDYPIDTIKIDQSFTKHIAKTNNVETIIKSLIFMAKGLDMNVVAEGVETIEQLSFLRQQECQEIQGYIFSKPVPEETFQNLLRKMILKPTFNSNTAKFSNRRRYYRINLLFPLSSQMTLTTILGNQVELGNTEILIEDIGPGGLRFLSTIQLPVRPDITYQFKTKIMGEIITLNGHVVWKEEVKGIFQYGLKFIMDETQRDVLVKFLNHFTLQLRNNPFVPNCDFVKEEKISYLLRATPNE